MRASENKEIGAQSDVQDLVQGRFPYLADIVVQNLKYIQKAIKRKVNFDQAKKTVHEDVKAPIILEPSVIGTPSIEYYPSGSILSSASYKDGVKHGLFQTFTEEGKLLSSREFKEGLEEGIHVYFYRDGKLKSQIPYLKGLLDGEVRLYHPNGVLKRSITYRMGKRHGFDTLNYINGSPLLKAEHREVIPLGKAMTWYIEGPMSMEVSYFTPGVIAQIKRWDAKGELIEQEGPKLDFMDTAVVNSLQLQNSIADMAHGLENLMVVLQKDFSADVNLELNQQVEGFDEEMLNLQKLGVELYEASGMGTDKKEAIWKTPSNERQLDAFIQGITSPMQESMLKLQWQLRSMIDKIQKESDEAKPDK
jgi:antitoxin component YwqK of YwqJK toxin-antitoxin module